MFKRIPWFVNYTVWDREFWVKDDCVKDIFLSRHSWDEGINCGRING